MGLRNKHLYHDENIFFITTTCFEWKKLLVVGKSFEIVADSLQFCANKYNALILSYVIMPNHIHLVLRFDDGKQRIGFMRDLKKFTSTKIRQEIEIHRPDLLDEILYLKGKQVFKIWQDRFDEVYLDSRELVEAKIEYIHSNPLQEHWNMCINPEDYPYSSAAYYEKGMEGIIQVQHYMDFV